MIKYYCCFLLFLCSATIAFCQADTSRQTMPPAIFERIGKEMKEYKPDTSAPPDDKITKKITELRVLRGGFNINEAIEFKIAEDRQQNKATPQELDKLSAFFKTGNGKRWLDNAVIWIYRQHFTYTELKQLVKFYRTPAGQKMGNDLPIIIVKTLMSGEMIKELYTK